LSILVFITSASVTDNVEVTLMTTVEIASGCVTVEVAVSLTIAVVVVYTVTIGRDDEDSKVLELEATLEDRVADDEAILELSRVLEGRIVEDEAVAQVCAEPMPTVNGCVSTREKSMNLVEAKKFPSWNWTISASDNCCENEARLQALEPGP
jgi:hypothetical protein